MKKKFYITTAIDYVNAEPHIGHAYQKVVADALARWNRLIGRKVLFVTGTDEHGKKISESAEKKNIPVKKFVDEMAKKFKESWAALRVVPDRFIRTTDKDHEKVVIDFIKRCAKAEDIYKGEYIGLYCTGCEAYYTEKDAVDGKCPLHNRTLEKINEETYFFKLSKYTKFLLDFYKENPNFITPKSKRKEVENKIKEGLRDLSITRTNFNWGIPFPLDKKHVTYVWFDALINYYTATRKKGLEDFWKGEIVHILGKDNTWFHTVYWPAMLKSAGISEPTITINHGFLTFNGQKISKSLGNAISPKILVEKYGSDTVRYFLLRHFSFISGSDGDFDESALVERHNNELANKLGNLVSRVSTLAEKHGIEKSKPSKKILGRIKEIEEATKTLIDVRGRKTKKKNKWTGKKPATVNLEYSESNIVGPIRRFIAEEGISLPVYQKVLPLILEKLLLEYKVDQALNEIFAFIDVCNEYVQEKKPWETKDKRVLYELVESLRKIAELLFPFIPDSAEKILKIFNAKRIKKAPVIFEKIEYEKPKKEIEVKEVMEGITTIEFCDFEKLDIRVAEIKKVENIEGADKLYKLTVDLGSETRTICAGLKEYYDTKELKGKKIIVLTNLKPRTLKGIESQGMLLAASDKDHKKVSLLVPDHNMEPGSRVS